MKITHSTRDGYLVVSLTGQLTPTTAPQVQRALLKDLAEQPSAIICDLGGVDALDPVCATVFATIANHPANRWPTTSLLLCAAQPAVAEVLGRLRVGHFLLLYDTLQDALAAATERPGYLRDELRLAPAPTTAAAARRFVGETLQSWGLAPPYGELSDQAQLLADELVTNAVVHAQTNIRLQLQLGGELLHIAVRDFDRRLPHPLPNDPRAEGGRGLRLVKWIATAWGAEHHPGGGKVVWCTLRTSRIRPWRPAEGEPSFPIVASKLAPPWRRPGAIPRPTLLGRLTATGGVPVAALMAPPGYGKTTLLAQWAEQDPRPVVWLSVDQHDNDPGVLLTYFAVALDRVGSVDPAVFGMLASPGTSLVAVVPRLGAALATAAGPLVVVLDDIQLLLNQECLDAVMILVDHLGEGSQLVIAGRGEPLLPMARLRVEGRVVELGPDALRMDRDEAGALLQAAGVQLPDADIAELLEQTEGWPLALHLAALSLEATGTRPDAGAALDAARPSLVAYLQSVLLSELSPDTVQFLARTSVLDRLSGPLCDAVLDATGSAQTLERLQRSNLLVIPLDDQRQWYRYHRMFRELLRAELERREPELVDELVLRAAAWCEHHGLPETSIDYALQAGDAEHAARLVGDLGLGACPSGRLATVRPWLAWFERHDLVERHPGVAVLGAWVHALAGHAADAERWADAAERAVSMETPPERSIPMQGWLAALRAAMCRKGVEQSCGDAELACTLLPRGNPWRATAFLLLGMAHLTLGNLDSADQQLAEAVELAEDSGATATSVLALAERAVVANDRETWPQSELLIERARSVAHHERLDDDVTSILLYAAAARVAVHQGEVQRARAELTHAQRPRPRLTVALPVYAVQARLELARTYLALSDVAGARTMLREVDEVLRRRPHLGVLGRQAEELGAQVDTMHANMLGASALTAAELRLLPLLATHLSFRELGERLDLSPHTVKTQAISIYRKLGASTRSQAIQHAQQLGLLPA